MKSIKKLLLIKVLVLLLLAQFYVCSAQIQWGRDIDGKGRWDSFGSPVKMPDPYTFIAADDPGGDGDPLNPLLVHVYRWNGQEWKQKGQSLDYDGSSNIDMPDSNTLALVDNKYNSITRQFDYWVRAYKWNGSSWEAFGNDITAETYITSVKMPDRNTIAIGMPKDRNYYGDHFGKVRIYKWDGNSWSQKGSDIQGKSIREYFGEYIEMPDSNTIAISSYFDRPSSVGPELVRVYKWRTNEWVQMGDEITGIDSVGFGYFSCMPDTNTLAIASYGSTLDDDVYKNGFVRFYTWNGAHWIQDRPDITGDTLGTPLIISMPTPDIIAVSSLYGSAKIYNWNGLRWEQMGVEIQPEELISIYPTYISMPDVETVAIGAPYNNGNGFRSGSVRVYKLKGIHGLVYNDLNKNCIHDEASFARNIRGTIQPGNIVVQTNRYGRWSIDSLPAGNYTLTLDTTSGWRSSCSNSLNFTVDGMKAITLVPDIGMWNSITCPKPEVSVHIPVIRPGFSNQKMYINACNATIAKDTIQDAFVVVDMDPLLIPDSASVPFVSLGNNQYKYIVGNLAPGNCTNITVSCSLSTQAFIGQTLCIKAELFPYYLCDYTNFKSGQSPLINTTCALPYDSSDIKVKAWCNQDSVYFEIRNKGKQGSGDMKCFSHVRTFNDGAMILLDSIKLNGGQADTIQFPTAGYSWRTEVD
ncbi:MAG: hypothetical protein MUF42_13940 [Cytophagaceae bacterium]|jgi:hypothetical protein|nr:hypothetical protein [Cytophagaceae bacterium]